MFSAAFASVVAIGSSDSCSPHCPQGSCGWYGCATAADCQSGGALGACGGAGATCGGPFTAGYGYCVPAFTENNSSKDTAEEVADSEQLAVTVTSSGCSPPHCPSGSCGWYGCATDADCHSGGALGACGGTGATCGPPFTAGYGYCVPAGQSSQAEVMDSEPLAVTANSSDSCSPHCPQGSCGWYGCATAADCHSGGASGACGGTGATCGPPFTAGYGYCVPAAQSSQAELVLLETESKVVTDSKFLAKKAPVLTANASDSCSPHCPQGSCGWYGCATAADCQSGGATICGAGAYCGGPFTAGYGYCVPR